jgi:hypothetical protein
MCMEACVLDLKLSYGSDNEEYHPLEREAV